MQRLKQKHLFWSSAISGFIHIFKPKLFLKIGFYSNRTQQSRPPLWKCYFFFANSPG